MIKEIIADKWDVRFFELAETVAKWSKDPSTQVGCVVTKGNSVISLGYNGFPFGVDDSYERLNNREEKYKFVLHAEENAILNANSSIADSSVYVTHFPCNHCMAMLAQSGIAEVLFTENAQGWEKRFPDSFRVACEIANESNIDLIKIVED